MNDPFYDNCYDTAVTTNDALNLAEQNLVGAAILDHKVFHEAALKYSQFLNPKYQLAWKTLGKLLDAHDRVDEIMLSDACNGKVTLGDLSKCTLHVEPNNTLNWANLVRDSYVQRGVAQLSSEFKKWADSGLTGPQMLDKVHKRIEDLENASEPKLPTLADCATAEIARIKSTSLQELQGLPTGLGIERVVPGGIPRGKVTTVFGESGNFKTTVKNNIVLGIAEAGYRVLDVSLEDADELTAHRFLAKQTGLNYGRISAGALTEGDREKLELSEQAISIGKNVILAGEILPNIDEIIRTARAYKHRGGLDAVVVDYVQLLESRNPRASQKEVLDEIMRKSQLAAKRDNMAYIIVSQVKQDVDMRTDHSPRITDMVGSSAMRTASKLSIGVFRPGLYHDTPPKGSPYAKVVANHPGGLETYKNILELHFLKNVLGEPRVVVHCLVNPGTGQIKPFDMRTYL